MKPLPSLVLVLAALALLLQACSPTPPVVATPQVITVVVQVTGVSPDVLTPQVQATDTPSIPVTAVESTATVAVVENTPAPTATSGPQCVALRNINLRKGPGVVYDPPIGVVKKDEAVVPDGFSPVGFPNGTWVQVTIPQTGERGWITTDPSLVNCTFDVTTLPVVGAPPTPAQLRVRASKPEGTPNGITANLLFSSRDLLRFEAFGPLGKADGDGIKEVRFLVRDETGGITYYDHTEREAPYCIFGGDNGCNAWPRANGAYTWGSGGERVESGKTYQFDIFATAEGEFGDVYGNWNFPAVIELP